MPLPLDLQVRGKAKRPFGTFGRDLPVILPERTGRREGVGKEVGEAGSRSRRLTNRLGERHKLDRIVAAVRDGESLVLAVTGEPGVGESVLLDYLGDRAPDCRVLPGAGARLAC